MSKTFISEISSGGDVSQEDLDKLKAIISNNKGLDRLNRRKFEEVMKGDAKLSGDDLENYEPEYFTRYYFIDKLLELLGYDPGRGEYTGQTSGDNPDYRFETDKEAILGEAKPLGRIKDAEDDMEDYLNRKDLQSDYGIATDGVNWTVMKYEDGQVSRATVSLYPVFLEAIGQETFSEQKAELNNFIAYLKKENFFDSADDVAVEFKKKKKEVTQQFFDDYIKLVFGSSGEYCLLDGVEPAANASRRDKRLFSVELMNKLLFIKFLEDREIIREDLIPDLWQDYKDRNPRSSFYKESLEPLFFEVMNTKRKNRSKRIENDPLIGDIEYLNGGLFRQTVPNERSYDVENDIIEEIIDRLIHPYSFTVGNEGEALDPSILGKVFEKTINFLTSEKDEDRQKIKGAYYTPDDVTSFLSEESLKPYLFDRFREELIDSYGYNPQEFDSLYDNLEDLLSIDEEISKSPKDAVMKALYEKVVKDVKVVDPGCGSGHFLTSVLDELFWIRKSFCDRFDIAYESDRKLIEDIIKENIYGVDVEEPAVEIAKLRLWLRILYEAEPEDELSKLPNIDYNIRAGNSLIGFLDPESGINGGNKVSNFVKSSKLERYWKDIEDFREDDYEGSAQDMKQEIDNLNADMEDSLNKWFASEKDAKIKEEIESVERLREIIDGGKKETRKFTVYKDTDNGVSFTEREKEFLDEKGFNTYKYKAYVKIKPEQLELQQEVDRLLDGLDEIINSINAEKFEIEREVLKEDIEETGTFHWIMEFEEIVERGGFDIVIGNPPYGQDIMSDKEVSILEDWQSDGCRDICGYFLEREIELVREGGYVSNIIADSLAVNKSMTSVRDLMRDQGRFNLSFFGTRPSKIFDTVEERVCIITGKINGEETPIQSSKNIRFTSEMRENLFGDIEYAPTEELLLGSRLGVRKDGENTRLPKIGSEEKRSILLKLKENKAAIEDLIDSDGENEIQIKATGGYWLHSLYDFPYNSSKIRTLRAEDSLHIDFSLIAFNSSLFYVYWTVFGNNRDLPESMFKSLPIPEKETLEDNAEEIHRLAEEIDKKLQQNFNPNVGRKGEFDTKMCKSKIDEIDRLLGEIYSLSDDQVEFIQNYDEHIRPNPSNLESFDQ